MRRSEWLNWVTMAALATAAMVTGACGGGAPPALAAGADEPEPPGPAIQYGTLGASGTSAVAPQHMSPQPGAMVTSSQPEFAWTDVPGAIGFEVQVSNDARFPDGGTIESGVVETRSWTVPEPIAGGTTYYWRARAVYRLGADGVWSDYSPFSLPSSASASAPVTAGNGTSTENGISSVGVRIAVGDRGTVIASLAIWDATQNVLLTTEGRTLEEVIRGLEEGRVYQFAATLDMVLHPRDFGIDRNSIHLTGGQPRLIFW